MEDKVKPLTACGNSDCNGINSGIDQCIEPIIRALNACGAETVASCCGHGRRPGNIALRDGRELIIATDFDTARVIDSYFPDIQGEMVGTVKEHALTDEVKHLKETIHTAGFLLADEKAEVARLSEALGEAAGVIEDAQLEWGSSNRDTSNPYTEPLAKINQLLNSKGTEDNT